MHANVAGAGDGWRVLPSGVAKLALVEVNPIKPCTSPPGGPCGFFWVFYVLFDGGCPCRCNFVSLATCTSRPWSLPAQASLLLVLLICLVLV